MIMIDLSDVKLEPEINALQPARKNSIPDFIDEMIRCGVIPRKRAHLERELENNYEIIRFAIDSDPDGSKSGACRLFDSQGKGVLHGWFQNHKGTGQLQKWTSPLTNSDNNTSKTPIQKALNLKNRAREASDAHPYLQSKKIKGFSLLQAKYNGEDVLLVSGQNAEGKLQTIQTINPEGVKRFFRGCKKKGAFHRIPGNKEKVILCEGYATGETIATVTGYEVIVCFDASNLKEVSRNLTQKDDLTYLVAADNDKFADGNPGITKAKATGLPFFYPIFKKDDRGTDWNDFFCLYGEECTINAIKRKLTELDAKIAPIPAHKFPDISLSERPLATIENIQFLLEHFNITCVYDEVARDFETHIPKAGYSDDNVKNNSIIHIQSLATKCGLPKMDIASMIQTIGDRRRVNPIKEWLESRDWDGVSRFSELKNTLHISPAHDKFANILLKKWLISAVAALYEPDFHSRGVLVLQGKQSLGKTTWLKKLVGPMGKYFKEGAILDPREKDTIIIASSKWIVELGELGSTFNKADLGRLKAFISDSEDEVRKPYARVNERLKRRTVFSATVNDIEFLRDLTGNSRWWVIPCEAIKYNHDLDMQQVWAEILNNYYLRGQIWWLTPEEEKELERLNNYFEVTDPLEIRLDNYYDFEEPSAEWKSSFEIFELIDLFKHTRSDTVRLGHILQRKGVTNKRTARGKLYHVPRLNQRFRIVT